MAAETPGEPRYRLRWTGAAGPYRMDFPTQETRERFIARNERNLRDFLVIDVSPRGQEATLYVRSPRETVRMWDGGAEVEIRRQGRGLAAYALSLPGEGKIGTETLVGSRWGPWARRRLRAHLSRRLRPPGHEPDVIERLRVEGPNMRAPLAPGASATTRPGPLASSEPGAVSAHPERYLRDDPWDLEPPANPEPLFSPPDLPTSAAAAEQAWMRDLTLKTIKQLVRDVRLDPRGDVQDRIARLDPLRDATRACGMEPVLDAALLICRAEADDAFARDLYPGEPPTQDWAAPLPRPPYALDGLAVGDRVVIELPDSWLRRPHHGARATVIGLSAREHRATVLYDLRPGPEGRSWYFVDTGHLRLLDNPEPLIPPEAWEAAVDETLPPHHIRITGGGVEMGVWDTTTEPWTRVEEPDTEGPWRPRTSPEEPRDKPTPEAPGGGDEAPDTMTPRGETHDE